ncbi:10352_t:CDS:2, partial [Gigaspora margarita]
SVNNMESEFIYQTFDKTCTNTDVMEFERVFETFENNMYNSTMDTIETKCTFGTLNKAFIDNNVVNPEYTLKLHIDSSAVKVGSTFSTFSEAHKTIERYAAQTSPVIILGKTTRNSDNNNYRQALFVCEKQGKYNGTNEVHTTKRFGYPFAIAINYRKRSQLFVITKSVLEHNHESCLDARNFSIIARKFDKDDLGLIEKLHSDGLRTKDIFSVLNSVSCKYVHKPDVYNAVSRHHQHKLQGLNEVEMLFKTLCGDENILGYTALKAAYNTERDQDGEFIQGIFWAYRSAFSEFMIAKDVIIVDATYKTNRFSMPLIVICSIDRFGSTYPLAFALVYSETVDFYCRVMQQLNKALIELTGNAQVATMVTDRELALMTAISREFPHVRHQLCTWHIFKNIRSKLKKHVDIDEFIKTIQKLAYDDNLEINQIDQEIAALWKRFPEAKTYMCEIWLPYKTSWLSPYTKCNMNLNIKSSQCVESLHSKLKGVENWITPVDKLLTTLWRQLQESSQKIAYETFLYQSKHVNDSGDSGLENLRLACSKYAFEAFVKPQGDLAKSGVYEVFEIYLLFLHTYVPSSEIHQRWHVKHCEEIKHPHVMQIFKQIPKFHHNAFLNLMEQVSDHVIKYGKVPELLPSELNITHKSTFEAISINNLSLDRIKMPIIKHTRGQPKNNKRIHSKDEEKAPSKKASVRKKLDKNGMAALHSPSTYSNSYISQDMILQVHNPISDGHYEERWQDIKVTMKNLLDEQKEFYADILASDAFNVPIAVIGADSAACLFFLPYNQKP